MKREPVTETISDADRATQLRDDLVDALRGAGHITSSEVERAFRTVPRHLFAPGVTLEAAYAQGIVVVKKDDRGTTTSSVSAPEIQALMLEQANLAPGMRVLEVGSGGFNAALIAELVGASGQVTTVDIDADVTKRAEACLDAAGYSDVRVVTADAEYGVPDGAPYDGMVVTVGVWDLPPAWAAQLTSAGRVVVPLRLRGLTRSWAFERDGDDLVAGGGRVCGFVKVQGAGAHDERLLLLRGEGDKEVGLRFDEDWPAEPELLNGVLDSPRVEAWSGVVLPPAASFATLQLWLATIFDGYCQVAVDPQLDTGTVTPIGRRSGDAVRDGDSFAHLAARRVDGGSELGAHGFGPHGAALAETMRDQIRVWNRDHREGPGPTIRAVPKSAAADVSAARVVEKRHVRILISWP